MADIDLNAQIRALVKEDLVSVNSVGEYLPFNTLPILEPDGSRHGAFCREPEGESAGR